MRLAEGKEVILCIGDQHHPFAHKDSLDFVKAVAKEYKPTVLINMGDEGDQHSLGRFDPDPDGYGPGMEFEAMIDHLKPWYKAFPEMLVCHSNHMVRGHKKAFTAGLPKGLLRPIDEVLEAPRGWVWKDKWEIDGILFEHGEGFTGATGHIKAAEARMQSIVIGHIHAHAAVHYLSNEHDMIFGFNVGCLIDRKAYAFKYAKNLRYKPTLGVGIILYGVPHFIPMILDKHERWIGKL